MTYKKPAWTCFEEHLGALIAQGNPSADGFIRARANAAAPQESSEHVSEKHVRAGLQGTPEYIIFKRSFKNDTNIKTTAHCGSFYIPLFRNRYCAAEAFAYVVVVFPRTYLVKGKRPLATRGRCHALIERCRRSRGAMILK